MNKIILSVLATLLLFAPLELTAKQVVKHHTAKAQTRPTTQATPRSANPNCALGATPPAGTQCGISDLTLRPGGALQDTDTMRLCPYADVGGCFGGEATYQDAQAPLSYWKSYFLSKLSATAPITYNPSTGVIGFSGGIPNAALLGGNGSVLNGVNVGTGLNLSGGTLSATGSVASAGPVYVGTITNSGNNYTLASSVPHTSNTPYDVACGTVANSNTGPANLIVGSAPQLAINKQSISSAAVALANGDLPGSANTVCFQLNSGGTAWVMFTLSSPAAPIFNSTSTVTAQQWQSGQTYIYTNYPSPTGSIGTLTLPSAATLGGGAIYIITRGGGMTLALALGTDGINALAPGTSLAVPDGVNTTVVTNGSGGGGTFTVPLGPTLKADLSWIAGQNLGSCASPPCSVPMFHIGQPVVINGAFCQIALANTGTATFDFVYVLDGGITMVPINSGTACNASGTAGTLQSATLTTTLIPAPSIIGLRVNQSWASVLGSGLAEIGYNRD